MAKRGEGRGAEGEKKATATIKKVGRKEQALQEAARRVALTEGIKSPAGEAAAVAPAPETPTPAVTPAAETAGAKDVAAPTPTAPTTVDEAREKAIAAMVDTAARAYEAAKEKGEGFVLGAMFSREVAKLKNEFGAAAYEEVKDLFAAQKQAIDGKKTPTDTPSNPAHPGSGELRKGEFRGFKLNPDTQTLQAEWSEIGIEEASPAWAKIVRTATERFGADWFGDVAKRNKFTQALASLRSRIEASLDEMKITSEQGSKSPLTAETTFEGETFDVSVGGSETARMKKARSDLRNKIIKAALDTFLSEFAKTHDIAHRLEIKMPTLEVDTDTITVGGETTYMLSMTMPDGRVAKAEWGIDEIVSADKLAAGLTASEIQALAEEKFREEVYKGTIKAVKIDVAPAPTRSAVGRKEGSQARSPRKDRGAPSRSAKGENEDEDTGSHRKGRPEGSKKGGATIRKTEAVEGPLQDGMPRREPSSRPRVIVTPEQRLAMMKEDFVALNSKIEEIDKEKVGVQRGSDTMAEIAARQTPLMLERQALKKQIALLEEQTKDLRHPAPAAAVVDVAAGDPKAASAVDVAAPPEAAPTPEPTPTPSGAKQLDDNKRIELTRQLTQATRELTAHRQKIARLQELERRKGNLTKNERSQLTYETERVQKNEVRIARLRAQLETEGRVTKEEKETEERRGLPIFIRKGIQLIAESVAAARVLAEQLQSYGEEKVGASRAEAIDNAIEIINAAEKERAQIVASLEEKPDVTALHTLYGKSTNMAVESAAALQRLKGFAKEMESGGLEEHPVSGGADARANENKQERAALEAQLREINGRIASLTEQQNTMRAAVDGNKSTLRNIGRDEGARKQFLEEAAQLENNLKKLTNTLQGLKTLRDQLTNRLAALEASPAESGKPQEGGQQQGGATDEIPADIFDDRAEQAKQTHELLMQRGIQNFASSSFFLNDSHYFILSFRRKIDDGEEARDEIAVPLNDIALRLSQEDRDIVNTVDSNEWDFRLWDELQRVSFEIAEEKILQRAQDLDMGKTETIPEEMKQKTENLIYEINGFLDSSHGLLTDQAVASDLHFLENRTFLSDEARRIYTPSDDIFGSNLSQITTKEIEYQQLRRNHLQQIVESTLADWESKLVSIQSIHESTQISERQAAHLRMDIRSAAIYEREAISTLAQQGFAPDEIESITQVKSKLVSLEERLSEREARIAQREEEIAELERQLLELDSEK